MTTGAGVVGGGATTRDVEGAEIVRTTLRTARTTTIAAVGVEAGEAGEAATATTEAGDAGRLREETSRTRSSDPKLLTTGTTGG